MKENGFGREKRQNHPSERRWMLSMRPLSVVLMAAACGDYDAATTEGVLDDTGTVEEPILNGTLATTSAWHEVVRVLFTRTENCGCGQTAPCTGMCTGTLLRNDVVLTARHCVTNNAEWDGPVLAPSKIRVFQSRSTTVSSVAREVVAQPVSNALDVALIFLQDRLPVQGSPHNHFVPIYPYASELELNRQMFVAGYGAHTTEHCPTPDGNLRVGLPKITSVTLGWRQPRRHIKFEQVGTSGIQHLGDSGSTPFSLISHPRSAFAITNNCSIFGGAHLGNCDGPFAGAIREWALDAVDVRTPPHSDGFGAVLSLFNYQKFDPAIIPVTNGPSRWEWSSDQTLSEPSDIYSGPATFDPRLAEGTMMITMNHIVEDGFVGATVTSPDTNGAAGVVARFVDSSHYYVVTFDRQRARIRKRVVGGFVELGSVACSVSFATQKQMFVIVDGTRIEGSVFSPGGLPQCTVTAHDSQYPSGRAGIFKWSLSNAKFDDVFITHRGTKNTVWPAP